MPEDIQKDVYFAGGCPVNFVNQCLLDTMFDMFLEEFPMIIELLKQLYQLLHLCAAKMVERPGEHYLLELFAEAAQSLRFLHQHDDLVQIAEAGAEGELLFEGVSCDPEVREVIIFSINNHHLVYLRGR